jgi:MYXO-CTERM domain-containing protein
MSLRGLRAVPFLLLTWASTALGHARLTSPTPRSSADDIKDFNGGLTRCTDEATTVRPTVVVAGSMLRVTWDETVNHPGCFVLSLRQQPDGEFEDLATIAHSNAPPSPTQQNPRKYSATIQVPDVTCEHCVLLLRQIMLGTQTEPCPPATIPTGATYYSCADLRLVPPGTDAGVEEDGGSEPSPGDSPEDLNGCGCGSSGDALVPLLVLAGAAHLLTWRRRS